MADEPLKVYLAACRLKPMLLTMNSPSIWTAPAKSSATATDCRLHSDLAGSGDGY
ncbi:hypothetical protein J7E62_32710 [Variovorax paradoxus]|nr:hypothetical protein [Variovorax paradoxus]